MSGVLIAGGDEIAVSNDIELEGPLMPFVRAPRPTNADYDDARRAFAAHKKSDAYKAVVAEMRAATKKLNKCTCPACQAVEAESEAYEKGEIFRKQWNKKACGACTVLIACLTVITVKLLLVYVYVVSCNGGT